MSEYEIWKFLHICMFVFWLGTDMGVMICSKKSTDTSLSIPARFQLLEIALVIELLPRVMWVMALPFGIHLSKSLGYIDPSLITVAAMWVFVLTWLVINVGGAANLEKPWGQQLSKINRFVVASLGVSLIIVAISSYLGNGPILGIEIAFFPLGEAFARLAEEGSSPELEESISSGMRTTLMWVHSTYIMIFVVAFIGVTKIAG